MVYSDDYQIGNDTLIGGQGNDTLEGCEGDDIYIFNKGDGEDTVCDVNGKADEIRLGHESIGVVFERVNNDLTLKLKTSSKPCPPSKKTPA